VSGSGVSWAICKSALCPRQITMPAPHHSVFYRLFDLILFDLINSLCTARPAKVGNLPCLGDLNWPNINWSTWTSTIRTGSEIKLTDTLRKYFLKPNTLVNQPDLGVLITHNYSTHTIILWLSGFRSGQPG